MLEALQKVVPLAIPGNMFLVPVVAWLGLCIWAVGANLIRR